MLEFEVDLGGECFGLARREQSPYASSTIAVFRVGPDRIASLEGEVSLNAVYWGVVVVFDFAELQEARYRLSICSAEYYEFGWITSDLLFA